MSQGHLLCVLPWSSPRQCPLLWLCRWQGGGDHNEGACDPSQGRVLSLWANRSTSTVLPLTALPPPLAGFFVGPLISKPDTGRDEWLFLPTGSTCWCSLNPILPGSTHPFIPHVHTKCLLCARSCTSCWGLHSDRSAWFCPQGPCGPGRKQSR